MDALGNQHGEISFGVDPFNPRAARPIDAIGASCRSDLKRELMRACPRVPGVYGMLDRTGDLIYVGKSKSLRSRLLSYFSASNED